MNVVGVIKTLLVTLGVRARDYLLQTIGEKPPERIDILVVRALLKSLGVLCAALIVLLIALMFSNLGFSGFAFIAESLKHHGCTANPRFVTYAIGLAAFGLLLVTTRILVLEHLFRFVFKSSTEMLGHLSIAGLGFALVAEWHRLPSIWVYLIWFVAGACCFAISILYEKPIKDSPYSVVNQVVVSILFLILSGVGYWILSSSAVELAIPQTYVSCDTPSH